MPTPSPAALLLGTRPEAIKLAPVVLAMRTAGVAHAVVTTGQHGAMVDDALALFGIRADATLGLTRETGSLDELLSTAIERVGVELDRLGPALVVVQGDTTSMLGSVIAAFHRGIDVAHVEAGLRSGDPSMPFPEEMNRRVASVMARWHFAPTREAAANLAAEGHAGDVHVVGNPVVDAVRLILDRGVPTMPAEMAEFIGSAPYLVATAHRRESWDGGIARIAAALRDVLDAVPDHRLLFVTHPNPVARGPVDDLLGDDRRAMVVDALPYPAFLALVRGARLVVSDSGGVQEEGPALGVPVLVTRHVTERPEGVAAGALRLVGTDRASVRDEAVALLRGPERLAAMARAGQGIYGDGHAAERIVEVLAAALERAPSSAARTAV